MISLSFRCSGGTLKFDSEKIIFKILLAYKIIVFFGFIASWAKYSDTHSVKVQIDDFENDLWTWMGI